MGFEKNIIGAVGPPWEFSGYEHAIIAGRAFWFYLGKIFWPYPLNFMYPLWDIHHTPWTQVLFPMSAVAFFAVLWTGRRRWGKAPLAALSIFALCIAPALGFVHLYPLRFSFVADHFEYQGSLSVIALVACGLWLYAGRARNGLLAFLCVLLGAMTWKRAHVYRDPETLYRDILSKNPTCMMAMNNLAVTLLDKGIVPEARTLLTESIRLRPNDLYAQIEMGALKLSFENDPEGSFAYFQRAYNLILNLSPSHAQQSLEFSLHSQLGDAYFQAKQYPQAKEQFEAALGEIPALESRTFFDTTPEALASAEGTLRRHLDEMRADWRTHQRLADAWAAQGKNAEAVQEYQQAFDFNPGSQEIADRLGALLLKRGRKQEALAVYEASIRAHSHPSEKSH